MMNRYEMKANNGQKKGWRRFLALLSALMLLISSTGVTAFAEAPDEDIYSDPVTAPIPKPAADETPAPKTSEKPAEEETEKPLPEEETEKPAEEVTEKPAEEETEKPTEEETEKPSEEVTDEPSEEETEEPTEEVTEEPAEEEETPEPTPEIIYNPGTLTGEADGVTVRLDYTAEACIPDDATLVFSQASGVEYYSAMKTVSKLVRQEENTDSVWTRVLKEDGNIFYIVTLADSEGNEIQPAAAMTLTVENLTAGEEYYITGDNARKLTVENGILNIPEYGLESFGYVSFVLQQTGNITLEHKGRDYQVIATYGPDAGFPAGTELKVREILPGTAEYRLYSGMTDEALNEEWAEITLERYFDITFVADGKELEPEGFVDVQIIFRDKIEQNEETEVQAVHIENNEANVIEAETDSNKAAKHDAEAIDTVAFTSDSFSVFGVVQKKKITQKVLAADGNTYEINVTYTAEAAITEGSTLKVEEIPEGSDLWEAYRKQTAAALGADDVRLPGLYDITIIDPEGNPVEPVVPVNISIKLANAETDEDLHVVHFTEDIPQELVEAAAEEKKEEQTEVQSLTAEEMIAHETITDKTVEGDTVTFATAGFSVYAFAYTVDFYYGEYEYHLEGGTFMSLKNLLTILHIVEADQAQEFVNNIESVTFSDPTLLSVSKIEEDTTVRDEIEKLQLVPKYSFVLSDEEINTINDTKILATDWALISLEAFQTNETLTIKAKSGSVYSINVFDAAYDYDAFVNDKSAGRIVATGNNNVFVFYSNTTNYQNVQSVQYGPNWDVQYFQHIANRQNGSLKAEPYNGYEFAFWLIIGSDGSWTTIKDPTLASNRMVGVRFIAFFTPTNAKVVVRGTPDPSSAWHYTPRGTVRYAYYGIDGAQHDDVPRYNYTTDSNSGIEWQSSFDDGSNRDKYNFVGWFNENKYISKGHDVFDGYTKHNIALRDIKENTILIPKYELKEQYRDYRIVWFDGSDGVTNNIGDSTTLARINGNGVREGAGQEAKVVNKGDTITLPTTTTISFQKPLSDSLHHYAIDGWYDITTKQFYQPGESVRINNDTVFYASWFPANYNFATGSGAIATRDTSSFIDMHMYDYNSIYNMKWLNLTSSYITSSGHYEEWTMKGDPNEFIFLTTAGQWGRSINPHGRTLKNSNNEAGADNNHYNAWSANIAMPDDLTNDDIPGVKSAGSANYLFRYDNTTGYYYYDSSKNKAAYGNGRFYVYNGTEKTVPNYGTSDFLPFNDGQAEYNEPQGQPNYWFGMDTRIHFYLPDTPGAQVDGQTGNRSTKGDEMVFKFSGDDDVWVYLDDVLVLNMSGVHGLIYGEINFSDGTYTMAEGGTTKTVDSKGIMDHGSDGTITHGNLSGIEGLSSRLTPGEHTIRMVYLERGASQSNCAIYFNLAPKTQKLKIRKVTDLDMGIYKHTIKDAEFQIYTETDYLNGGQPIQPSETKQVTEMSEYYYGQTFVSDNVGRFFWGELPPGVYYIIETKAPHGLETLTDPIRMEINDTENKIYYGPVNASNPTVFKTKYTTSITDSTKYVDIYVNNRIKKGSIEVKKNWDESLASTETASKAILFRLERTPETDTNGDGISGNGYGNDGNYGIYDAPQNYGLTSANIYEHDETKYLKLNKNGNTWETLTISNLPMACVSKEKDENNNQAVVPCYYRVVETGYLGTDDVFHAIDPNLITVIYTATNAVDDDGHTAILAKDEDPDTLTITNKTDFTNVEVQKLWANNSPYADSVTVKLYRSVDAQEETVVSTNTTVHLSVTLTDADSKATTVTAHINGQDITLTKDGNVYTGDAVVPKGADYAITFTGTATDGYTVVIDNNEIAVGQNDEQNFSATGIVNAPAVVAQTRNITLTINWTGDGAWGGGNIWAQVFDSNWQSAIGFNNYFHRSNSTASALGVSTGADIVQIGGGFVYDDYEYSLSPETTYEKNGDRILIFNVPAGTDDASYTLTISPKTNNNNNTTDGSMTIRLHAINVIPKDPQWQIRANDSGPIHSSDYTINNYTFSPSFDLNPSCNLISVTISKEDVAKGKTLSFKYGESNTTNLSVSCDSQYIRINQTTGEVTITPAAAVVDIYFTSVNNSSDRLIPLRTLASTGTIHGLSGTRGNHLYRADAGLPSESPATIIQIALNLPSAEISNDQPDVSEMTQVGEAVVLTSSMTNSDGSKQWYYKWENLPAVDENGHAYHYYVVEEAPDNTSAVGYSREETPALTSIEITNTPAETPSYARFDVKKTVTGTTEDKTFSVKLKREKNDVTEWLNRTSADLWNWGTEANATVFEFKDNEVLSFRGLEINYIYTAIEDTNNVDISGLVYDTATSVTTATAEITEARTYQGTITNVYNPPKGSITITKRVDGYTGEGTYRIAIKDEENNYYYTDGSSQDTPLYLEFQKDESKTWDSLPIQTYYVEELDAEVDGYNWTVEAPDSITVISGGNQAVEVINHYVQGYHLIVRKEWQNSSGNVVTGTESIQFKLIRHEDNHGQSNPSTQLENATIQLRTAYDQNEIYHIDGKDWSFASYDDGSAIHVGDVAKVSFVAGWYGNKGHWGQGHPSNVTDNDKQSGKIEITISVNNATTPVYFDFNTYSSGTLSVQKVSGAETTSESSSASNTDAVLKPASGGEGYEPDPSGNYVYTLAPGQTIRFNNLPYTDGPGEKTYTYEVVETTTGYTTSYRPANATYDPAPVGGISPNGEIVIVNKPTEIPTLGHLTVRKVIIGMNLKDSYKIGVYDTQGNYYDYDGTNKGTEPYYLEIPAGESRTWSNLVPGKYTIEEVDAEVEGFVLEATGTGDVDVVAGTNPVIDVTNTYRYPVGITATKRWPTDTPRATAVQFTLKRQAGEYGTISIVPTANNPATVTAENHWTAHWEDLDKYADDHGTEYLYFVIETGLYFGDTAISPIPDDAWTDPKISYVEGGDVVFDDEGSSLVEIRNIEKINVPVTKTWDAYVGSEYSWTVDFKLQQKEELVSGDPAPDAINDWTDMEGKTLKVSKNSASSTTFDDLDLFRVHDNGSVYRILYHAVETAYEVKKQENGAETLVCRWSATDATLNYSDNGKDYKPYYIQNAGEDKTIQDLLNRYTIVVENKPEEHYENKLVVHKEWLDIYPQDLKYYPKVYVSLYKIPASQFASNDMSMMDKAELYAPNDPTYTHHELSYEDNKWTWVIEGLPSDYVYFVIEEPLNVQGTTRAFKNGSILTGRLIETDPIYSTSRDPKMGITLESYKARDTYGSGTWRGGNWQEAVYAYTGNTGEILIQNNAPSMYMQMDLKKKFLEYRIDDNGVYSLWTTTHESDTMKDMIIEIQIMRRRIDESQGEFAYLDNGKWEPYGNTIFVGYDKAGKAYIDPNNNLFQVINGDGTWHFRIPCNDQHEGLPRRGYYPVDNEIRVVRYQYILKEVQVYDGSMNPIGSGWAAWLPWLWDGRTDTPSQYEVNVPATAQDQDRLFNAPGTSLTIEKEWNVSTSDIDVKEIYIKVWRRPHSNNGTPNPSEDYTAFISQHINVGLGDGYLESGDLNTSKGWLVLKPGNGWKATLGKVQIIPKDFNKGMYEYYITEEGYLDQNDTFHNAAEAEARFKPKYYKQVDTNTPDLQEDGLLLQWKKTNKLIASNTIDVTAIPVKKVWTGGALDFNASVEVELVKVVDGTEVAFNPAKKLILTSDEDETKNWKGIFGGLAKTDDQGNPITYRVKETRVIINGMNEYTGEGLANLFGPTAFTITSDNITSETVAEITNTIGTKTISAEKQWDGSDNWPEKMSVTFTLSAKAGESDYTIPVTTDNRYGANTPSVTVNSADTVKRVTWTNLPKWAFINGVATEITYSVTETSIKYDGVELVTSFNDVYDVEVKPVDSNGIVFINNKQRTTQIEVSKTWTGEEGWPEGIASVQVGLKRIVTGGTAENVMKDESRWVENITSSSNAVFTQLPVYDEHGNKYTYSIEEISVTLTNGTVVTKAENRIVITGTYANTWQVVESNVNEDGTATITNTKVTTNFDILKVNGKDETKLQPLTGAEFKLEKKGVNGEFAVLAGYETITVDGEGHADIDGLTDGEYKLYETKSPAGYVAYTGEIAFNIANGVISFADLQYVTYAKEDGKDGVFTVRNYPGAELPATGGSGTLIYTITGMALVMLAGVIFLARRKRNHI